MIAVGECSHGLSKRRRSHFHHFVFVPLRDLRGGSPKFRLSRDSGEMTFSASVNRVSNKSRRDLIDCRAM